jgi:RNA polymerase sigma factor (sigma-70 family)
MAGKTITDVVLDQGRAERLRSALIMTDAQLLERFAVQREESAFEALLHRHGPLVFGVCLRLLCNPHDAEDAFQATFLILARKAGSIGRPALLGNWLYGVAHRVAARARKTSLRRHMRETTDADLATIPNGEPPGEPDFAPLLHEELQRLPDKYRSPVVLCYLEGKTNKEAADQLQWPVGTVKGRLNRARELLRKRLARRGVALTVGLLAANTLTAKAPAALLDGTSRAALAFAAKGAVVGSASTQALALTKGVLQIMLLSRMKIVAAVILAVTLVAGGLAYHGLAVEPPAKADKKADKPKDDRQAIQGTWKVVSIEMDGKKDPEGEEFDLIRKAKITFTKEKHVMQLGGGEKEYTYKLDPKQKPKAIDLEREGEASVRAVYMLDGDTLKICAANAGKGGGDRPTEVATEEGDGRLLVVLKREAKEKPQDK